jgi:hypothetical protein
MIYEAEELALRSEGPHISQCPKCLDESTQLSQLHSFYRSQDYCCQGTISINQWMMGRPYTLFKLVIVLVAALLLSDRVSGRIVSDATHILT